MTSISLKGTSGNDYFDKSAEANQFKIVAGSGADTIFGGLSDDELAGDDGNDILDGGGGSDGIKGGAGNDLLIYTLAQNTGTFDKVDGGSGLDTLQLRFTFQEWVNPLVQADVSRVSSAFNGSDGSTFDFSAIGMAGKGFETLEIEVGGNALSTQDDPVTAHNDIASLSEDDAAVSINLLANDTAPDLIRSVEIISGPSLGSVTLASMLGDPAAQSAIIVFTPGAAFQHLNTGQTSVQNITYRITDADGDVSTATVEITVSGADEGPPTFSQIQYSAPGRAIAAGDINGDGNSDFVVSSPYGIEQGVIFTGSADGTFTQAGALQLPFGGSIAVFLEDIDGDNRLDLITVQSNEGTIGVALGNGDATFGALTTYSALASGWGQGPGYATFGDVNSDGSKDIITGGTVNGNVALLLGNGDGSFQDANLIAQSSATAGDVQLADYNGDSVLDLAYATGAEVRVAQGNGDGSFTDVWAYGANGRVRAGDMNGDGKADLIVGQNGSVLTFIANGDGTFAAPMQQEIGGGPLEMTLGDVNDDGALDILTANYGNGSVSLVLGNGDGSFQPYVDYSIVGGPASIALGDFNHDSHTDLLVASHDSFTVTAMLQTAAFIA